MALTAKEHLRLEDISDRALLEVLEIVQVDRFTGASSEDIAEELGLDVQYPKRCVSSRFSWMRRYGVLERDEETEHWRFTEEGWKLHKGQLKGQELASLKRMGDAKLAAVSSIIAERLESLSETSYHLARREMVTGHAKRRLGYAR